MSPDPRLWIGGSPHLRTFFPHQIQTPNSCPGCCPPSPPCSRATYDDLRAPCGGRPQRTLVRSRTPRSRTSALSEAPPLWLPPPPSPSPPSPPQLRRGPARLRRRPLHLPPQLRARPPPPALPSSRPDVSKRSRVLSASRRCAAPHPGQGRRRLTTAAHSTRPRTTTWSRWWTSAQASGADRRAAARAPSPRGSATGNGRGGARTSHDAAAAPSRARGCACVAFQVFK